MNPQKTTETKVLDRQPDLLDQIIESTKDVGVTYSATGLEATSFTGLCTLAKMIFDSGAAPKSMDSSKKVLIAIAYGQTIGLNIWQSMKAIYIVNGMPSVWGRTVLALCRNNPDWDESGFDEYWEIKGERQNSHPVKFDDDTITAVCQTMRKGASKPMVRKFSVADAKRAGLWSNSSKLYGPYPQRLLPARALGYCLDDNFGDSLKGITIRETFDEEVDGKPTVTSGDELRGEIEKRKKNGSSLAKVDAQASETIKEAAKQSFPHVELEPEQKAQMKQEISKTFDTISDVLKKDPIDRPPLHQVLKGEELSDLDIARDVLKGIYNRIPLKQNPIECLKKASLEDGTWIEFSHIENISDVDYLNRIAARLEEFSAMGAKA